jgi:DNA-binding transcriptional ArsR family regulator
MSDVRIDYELDDFVRLDTPERLRAASEPVRAHILDLVLERAMTVTELASRTGKAKGTIAHHVDLLVEHGLLKVVRVRKVRAIEERFYGRVARTMMFDGGPGHDLGDDLPFFAEARNEADLDTMKSDAAPGCFTLRHARIPVERAKEWAERLDALALEFSQQPRGGDTEFAVIIGMFPTKRRVTPRKKAKKSPS